MPVSTSEKKPGKATSKRGREKKVSNNEPQASIYDLDHENWIKILKLFFDGPLITIHIREVARRTGMSPRGAKYILDALTKEGLLNLTPTGVVSNYSGNYQSEKYMALKKSLNLYSLYSCGLVSALEEFYHTPKCIVLFGSYARGEDTGRSDIDIVIVTDNQDIPDLDMYESFINRKISISLVKNVKKEDSNFVNSLANGIVLSGYLEVS
jgi:predicted nucleotidyltransferase